MAQLSEAAVKEIGGLIDERLRGISLDPATATKKEIAEQRQLIEMLSAQNDDISAKINGQVHTKTNNYVSLEDALWSAAKAKKAEIEAIVKANGRQTEPLVFQVGTKAAVDITTSNTIGAGATQYSLVQNNGQISKIRQREERYLSVAAPGTIGAPRALWVEETDEQGVPVFIAEGETKTRVSVKYVEKIAEVRKIAVYGKVTTEMLADLPQLISYIQNNMAKRLSVKTEDQLIDGDGADDNLYGLTHYATPFSAGDLAAQIPMANELDVIRAIALQAELAYGIGNALFVNSADWAKIQLIKDTDGHPIWKEYEVAGTGRVVISGLEIIPTTAIASGEFVGGDMSVVNVLYREGLTVQIGLSGDDFINNKKTILVEQRLVQFVSGNDTQVLVKGTFAAAIAALNKVG